MCRPMIRRAALISLVLLALPALAAAKPPIVLELFTAQGCASCGEANSYVQKLAERTDVLPLTFSVDYWDYLGWKDTFARPEFAQRQKAYVARFGLQEPYTPQIVVEGRAEAPGLQTRKVERLLRDAAADRRSPPDIAFVSSRRVDVGSGVAPRGGGEVWLVRFDPRERAVEIKSGDNKGQTMVHKNVVRQIERLGGWRGRPTAYRLPTASEEGLSAVVLVQGTDGGRILAVGLPRPAKPQSPK